jgi:hypothetical protein
MTLTLTLMVEMEEISEMVVFNSTCTWLITQEDFNAFICYQSFKSSAIHLFCTLVWTRKIFTKWMILLDAGAINWDIALLFHPLTL